MIENNPMVNREPESEAEYAAFDQIGDDPENQYDPGPLFADPWQDEQTDFHQQRNRRYYCQFCSTTLPKVIPIFCPECKKRL